MTKEEEELKLRMQVIDILSALGYEYVHERLCFELSHESSNLLFFLNKENDLHIDFIFATNGSCLGSIRTSKNGKPVIFELVKDLGDIYTAVEILQNKNKTTREESNFKKSKYFTFKFDSVNGGVYATFGGEPTFTIIEFISKYTPVDITKHSTKTIINLCGKIYNLGKDNFGSGFFEKKGESMNFKAYEIFKETNSKGQAIKQMVDAETFLNEVVKLCKSELENPDLITTDFVQEMNTGEPTNVSLATYSRQEPISATVKENPGERNGII